MEDCPPSCSLSLPELFFSPSLSPPLFMSFNTGFLMGPALLLALPPPGWLDALWSDDILVESSPPRELLPPAPILLALRPCEELPPVLLLLGRGPHWVSVLCSRPPLWLTFWWGCC